MTQTVHRLEFRTIGENRWHSTSQEFSRESDANDVLEQSRNGQGICQSISIPAKYSPTTHEFRIRPIEKTQATDR